MKEADAVNGGVGGGVCGDPQLRAAVKGLYRTAERGDVAVLDGKTNHVLEVGEAWGTRVEMHDLPMSTKAIGYGKAAATMPEELFL